MKIIVCIKAVPGFITNPRVNNTLNRLEYEVGSIILNESDDYALEESVKLARKTGGKVTVVTAGTLSSQKALQIGLGKDADSAIRIDTTFNDPMQLAKAIAAAVRSMEFDLVMTGVESRDNMSAQVGVSIAEFLTLPFEYAVTKIEPSENNKTLKAIKELGFGLKQEVEIKLPALLCIQTGTVPPSFVPFRKMMLAQSKPFETRTLKDLGLEESFSKTNSAEISDIFSPKEASGAEIITGKPSEVASVFMARIREAM